MIFNQLKLVSIEKINNETFFVKQTHIQRYELGTSSMYMDIDWL